MREAQEDTDLRTAQLRNRPPSLPPRYPAKIAIGETAQSATVNMRNVSASSSGVSLTGFKSKASVFANYHAKPKAATIAPLNASFSPGDERTAPPTRRPPRNKARGKVDSKESPLRTS